MQTRRLTMSFEVLHSCLAQMAGKLRSYKVAWK